MGLDEHRGSLAGETVWVLAAGASVDFIPVSFWTGKHVVAVNFGGATLGLPHFWSATHYHLDAVALRQMRPDCLVAAPETDQGGTNLLGRALDDPGILTFPTAPQRFGAFEPERDWPTEPDHLVVGPTSLHFAMHFAAWLGAAHIVLAGADCGTLDESPNFTGHDNRSDNPMAVWEATLPGVAAQLRARGVSVMSLNPFVNFALEGHRYRSPRTSIN